MESLNNTDPIRFIDISVGKTYEDNGFKRTETGIHLIVFPYESNCDGNDFTSDPAIINYYRQFFLHLDEKLIDAKEGFFLHLNQEINPLKPLNRVYSNQELQRFLIF